MKSKDVGAFEKPCGTVRSKFVFRKAVLSFFILSGTVCLVLSFSGGGQTAILKDDGY